MILWEGKKPPHGSHPRRVSPGWSSEEAIIGAEFAIGPSRSFCYIRELLNAVL